MTKSPDILEQVDRYLAGQASPEEEAAIRQAAQADPDVIKALYIRSLLDQDLREFHQSAGAAAPAARRLSWGRPALAAAAAALVALGVGMFLRSSSPLPVLASVTQLIEKPDAEIVRNGQILPVAVATPLLKGDSIRVTGPGSVEVHSPAEGIRLVLGNHGELAMDAGDRYRLMSGRIEVKAEKRAGKREAFKFTTSRGMIEVLGTQFVLLADLRSSRVRVAEGVVRFSDAQNRNAVRVKAGECAMIHQDRPDIYQAAYEPGKTVVGDVLFSDDFESGPESLDRWKAMIIDETGVHHPLPAKLPAFASWARTERNGKMTGCLQLTGVGPQTNGLAALQPRDLPPLAGMLMELDVFYNVLPCSISYFSSYHDAYTGQYDNPQAAMLFTRMAQEKRWGHIRMESKTVHDPESVCTQQNRFILDPDIIQLTLSSPVHPSQVTLKPKKGTVLIDNVVIRELLTFE